MNNSGKGSTSRSVSSVAMLAKQRQTIGEFENKRTKNAGARQGPIPTPAKKRSGPKRRGNYADVKREASRQETVRKAQASTPYASVFQYGVATNAFNAAAAKRRQRNPDERATWQAEWGVYRSTSRMDSGTHGEVAFLHSFQQEHAKQTVMQKHGINQDERRGNIYEPNIYGNGEGHDMRSNSAWLLGLAHNKRKVVMTAPLDDTNLVRQSAQHGPRNRRNTTHNLSALGREVLGMVQHDHFRVGANDSHGNQMLEPAASATRAKLTDFKTPKGVQQAKLKRVFHAKGLDVSHIS